MPSFRNRCITALIGLFLALTLSAGFSSAGRAENIELPAIGDSSLGIMSPVEEEVLGQAWLKAFRSSVKIDDDPIIYEYVENLLYRLASESDLYKEGGDKTLDLLIVKNNVINAFAVPGGVVGVHTGLIDAAENEAQLVSVLAHELAHLFQRHFARGMDASRQANMISLLGALAGIAIAVGGGGGDAATAAIISGQAAAIDNQLSYSRLHEREADRLGMQNMVATGYSPQGAAQMFQVMQNKSRRYGQEIPEFLLTHPITQSRIADARLREQQIEREREKENREMPQLLDSTDFQLIKARVTLKNIETSKDAITFFQQNLKEAENSKLKNRQNHIDAARYGLAMAYLNGEQYGKAKTSLKPLLDQVPSRILYSLLDIEIDIKANSDDAAERRLRDLYALNPRNYSIGMRLSELLMDKEKPLDAALVLNNLSQRWPKQSFVWYHLAEAQGKASDILGLHRSRAEFFYLNGRYKDALQQLQQAYRYVKDDVKARASIRQRVREINEVRDREQALGLILG